MENLHYACTNVSSEHSYYWTIYYTHHMYVTAVHYVGMDESSVSTEEETFDDSHHSSIAASLPAQFEAPPDYTGKEMRKILHKFQNMVIQILKQGKRSFKKQSNKDKMPKSLLWPRSTHRTSIADLTHHLYLRICPTIATRVVFWHTNNWCQVSVSRPLASSQQLLYIMGSKIGAIGRVVHNIPATMPQPVKSPVSSMGPSDFVTSLFSKFLVLRTS